MIADAALANGGRVTGVIPQSLVDAEVAHTSLTELRVVDSMQERKAMMEELGDCFVAFPGGVGTLEELFEVWAGLVLGHHRKPLHAPRYGGVLEPAGLPGPQDRQLRVHERRGEPVVDHPYRGGPVRNRQWLGASEAALVSSFNVSRSQVSSATEVARAMVRIPLRNGSLTSRAVSGQSPS